MKKIAIVALVLASCTGPYATAKLTILGARAVVPVASTIMDGLNKAKLAECKKIGAEGSDAFAKCYDSMKKHWENWTKSRPIVMASLDEAEAIVRAAESANKKDVTTWIDPAKKAVCLVDATLVFLPQKYQDNVWVKTVRGFATSWAGCSSTSWRRKLLDRPELARALALRIESRISNP